MITQPDIIRSGYVDNDQVGPIAVTSEIKDETQGKMQAAINSEVQTALGGKASKDELLPLIYAAMVL